MCRYRSSITLAINHDEAHIVALAAVDRLGWRLTSESTGRITSQEVGSGEESALNPVRIAVTLVGEHRGPIELIVNGTAFGSGAAQVDHVKSRVDMMVQNIVRGAIQSLRTGRGDAISSFRSRTVIINRTRISDELIRALESVHGWPMRSGRFWYDRACGAWGVEGGPTAGFVPSNLDLGGPLRGDASSGDSGIYINGRELNHRELTAMQGFDRLRPGLYWLDARGDYGYEAGPRLGNLLDLPDQQPGNSTEPPQDEHCA